MADLKKNAVLQEFAIKQAPTLIVSKNGEVNRFVGVSAIKKFIG